MPFKSKSQMKACYAKKDKNWDCDAWKKKSKPYSELPSKSSKRKPRGK